MFKSYKETRFLGFRGIVSNVSDEFLTPGYVPDMENITINKEGLAENMPNPTEVDLFANIDDWSAGATIGVGDIILPTDKTSNKHFFVCTDAGTSGGTEPTWVTTTGGETTDNDVTWTEGGETTGSVNNIYYWADLATPILMVFLDRTLIDTKNGVGHIFTTDSSGLSFASVGTAPATNDYYLYIMSYYDGLFSYIPPRGTGFSNRTTVDQGNPPRSKYMIAYQNRLWAFGDLINSDNIMAYNRIMYSELPGDPETDPAAPNLGFNYWDADSTYDIVTQGQDNITAVIPFGQALFIFTKNNSIHVLSGYGTSLTLAEVYSGQDGAVAPYAISADGLYYIGADGFKMYSVPYPTTISDLIQPSIEDDIGTPQGLVRFEDRLYFLINGTIWAYHLLRKTWEKYSYSGANCLCSGDHLYIGTTNGKCYELDVAGTGYKTWYIDTPNISFGDLYRDKHFLNIKTYYKTTDAAATLKETFYLNHSASGTVLTDIDTYEAGATDEMREDHQQTVSDVAKTIQYKFYGTTQVRLFGYDVGYTVRWIKNV